MSKNTSVSLVSVLLRVCVFTAVTHCVKVECVCGGVGRWQSEARQCFVAILHLAPCGEVTAVTSQVCINGCERVSVWAPVSLCRQDVSVDNLVFLGVFPLTGCPCVFVCVRACVRGFHV